MTRNEIVDYEQRRWRKKLSEMRAIYNNAMKVYEKDPSKVNRIAVKAAGRVVDETQARYREWT